MKTSDFPSYTHIVKIAQGNTIGPFRAFLFSNGHTNKVLITMTISNDQGLEEFPFKISIEKDGGSIIIPIHAHGVVSISSSAGTLGTDVFVYGLS